MSGDKVIEISGLSKAYPLYPRPMDILKEMVLGGVRHDLFWALRDVSFSVRSGQRVGIIGPNGAGKSTLLQIIAGNLLPTSGSVEVNGKISALLSLVPAWNLEQTGIENIRFNLLLQGCSTAQISGLTRDIVDFAELGAFIHQPVKTYSTGMSARLSFAIATAISPEILIVDEVLGVGDGYFAGKAMRRMKEMCDKGKALLFVSHAIAAVRQLCDTAIWLESGGIRLMGPVDYVTAKYDEDMARSDDESVREANIQRVEKSLHFASPDDIPDPEMVRL
ncbi:MAG: ABC transporter ATP-binding protein, partial [Desulfarculus sp.]|nr:ABC transporter ATP-binding protein [Pseudomonadota bacterium]MBV1752642.1 ABC transporter ATP-binding protein [Desulfarculus sp.]